jgi:hypothetical protein
MALHPGLDDLREGTGRTNHPSYCQSHDNPEAAVKLKSWAGPAALAVAIVAIVGGAVWLTGRGGDSTGAGARPPLLHLSSVANGRDVAPMAASATGVNGGSGYVLTGTLPEGQPADRSVWRLRPSSATDAADVAAALGLSGTPARVDGGWVLRDGDNRLVVRDDSGWSYGMDCAPDQPVSNEDVSVMCAYATSGAAGSTNPSAGGDASTDVSSSPVPAPQPMPSIKPGPSESDARSAAARILDRLGLGDAALSVYAGDPSATVQASPRLGGLVTSGWVTSLQIDGDLHVVSADGWLHGATEQDTYPVVTAQRAFDLLQQQPRPMMEMCMQRKDGQPGCADVPPTEVTGASLGLILDYESERPVLVPAWLFDIKDQTEPVAQIAIEPAYLAPPPTASPDAGEIKPMPPVEVTPVPSAS